MKHYEVYLKFVDSNRNFHFVSISDILNVGAPIDAETGDDLELFDEVLRDKDGQPLALQN